MIYNHAYQTRCLVLPGTFPDQGKIKERRFLSGMNAGVPRAGETMEMTLTARGQFTFNKSLMEHLGVKVGEKISIRKLPGGKIEIEARKNKISTEVLLTTLRSTIKTDIRLGIEEINDVIAQSYVSAGMK
jgi:bifunctional DNA-binding transcriptional regulator/antitoxin component of YhaV-PrlF toxin-antitoxin module